MVRGSIFGLLLGGRPKNRIFKGNDFSAEGRPPPPAKKSRLLSDKMNKNTQHTVKHFLLKPFFVLSPLSTVQVLKNYFFKKGGKR